MTRRTDARDNEHLKRIAAKPRPVGSAANHDARQYCADVLRSLGFEVAERPFAFSALPGRYAAQIIGFVAVVGFANGVLFGESIGFITAIGIVALAIWLGGANATRRRLFTEYGVNLEATRGNEPQVWLVAHIDSKSQPIPSAVRAVGVVGVAVSVIGQLAVPFVGDHIISPVGVIGGAVLMLAAVGARSAGAADNASGVAAVLEAVAQLPKSGSIGVLITDAEELALAGAREWAASRGYKGFAINCDTVDDDGVITVIRYGRLPRGAESVVRAAGRVVSPFQLPGVLTDSNAFRAAGWETLTLARGTIRTLNRIHTPQDSLDNLRGRGIPEAARVLARLVEELA
jgi:hypothetical protein